MSPSDPKPEVVASFNPVEWDDFKWTTLRS